MWGTLLIIPLLHPTHMGSSSLGVVIFILFCFVLRQASIMELTLVDQADLCLCLQIVLIAGIKSVRHYHPTWRFSRGSMVYDLNHATQKSVSQCSPLTIGLWKCEVPAGVGDGQKLIGGV